MLPLLLYPSFARTYTSYHYNRLFCSHPITNSMIQLHTYNPAPLLLYAAIGFPPFPCILSLTFSGSTVLFSVHSLKSYISLHCFPLFSPYYLRISRLSYLIVQPLQSCQWLLRNFPTWFGCVTPLGRSLCHTLPEGRSSLYTHLNGTSVSLIVIV